MIVRQAVAVDAAQMAEIVNQIIAIGGTTAHQVPKSVSSVLVDYIEGPEVITSVVAEDQGQIIGWQSMGWYHGAADIGTFVRPGVQARGVGAAMFALTLEGARAKGIKAIMAAIRADNAPGLAYYKRIGFVDISTDPSFALKDGTVVGRVFRRFDV